MTWSSSFFFTLRMPTKRFPSFVVDRTPPKVKNAVYFDYPLYWATSIRLLIALRVSSTPIQPESTHGSAGLLIQPPPGR